MARTRLCSTRDLPGDGVHIVQSGRHEIGIIRHEGRLHAYRNLCPHQGGPVCEGVRIARVVAVLDEERRFARHDFDTGRMQIVCPWHGWEFSLETGEAVGDPAYRLRRYEVEECDGEIYADL